MAETSITNDDVQLIAISIYVYILMDVCVFTHISG